MPRASQETAQATVAGHRLLVIEAYPNHIVQSGQAFMRFRTLRVELLPANKGWPESNELPPEEFVAD